MNKFKQILLEERCNKKPFVDNLCQIHKNSSKDVLLFRLYPHPKVKRIHCVRTGVDFDAHNNGIGTPVISISDEDYNYLGDVAFPEYPDWKVFAVGGGGKEISVCLIKSK